MESQLKIMIYVEIFMNIWAKSCFYISIEIIYIYQREFLFFNHDAYKIGYATLNKRL